MSDDRNLGRLQDIEDKPQVERLGDNRAVISTGTVQEEDQEDSDTDNNSTVADNQADSQNDESNQKVSKTFTMKVQVERNGKVKQTKLKAESMRGLIQKFTFWASSVSDENLNDILKEV